MTGKFWGLWGLCRPAFRQRRCWENAGLLLAGILLNMGRHTISRSIFSAGAAGRDWSVADLAGKRIATPPVRASSGRSSRSQRGTHPRGRARSLTTRSAAAQSGSSCSRAIG